MAIISVGIDFSDNRTPWEPTEQDNIESLHKAAEQGDADAQHRLGMYYAKIQRIALEAAAKWYLKAAEQGQADAQYDLAMFYEDVSKHMAGGVDWLLKAAEQGDADAQYKLGMFKARVRARGIISAEESDEEAWFRKAAEQGHTDAQYELSKYSP